MAMSERQKENHCMHVIAQYLVSKVIRKIFIIFENRVSLFLEVFVIHSLYVFNSVADKVKRCHLQAVFDKLLK